MPDVVVNDLYALYPNLHIDVEREQGLLRRADIVIFQHPFYWYSAPAMLKKWIDVVLDEGFAYGPAGTALQGKAWQHSVTTGMPDLSYTVEGQNRATMAELLKPFECTAVFCGMRWLEPLILHEAHDVDSSRIARHAERLQSVIAEGVPPAGLPPEPP
jgi:putative NADPH-quinone reductase